jgi:hypothetical protein
MNLNDARNIPRYCFTTIAVSVPWLVWSAVPATIRARERRRSGRLVDTRHLRLHPTVCVPAANGSAIEKLHRPVDEKRPCSTSYSPNSCTAPSTRRRMATRTQSPERPMFSMPPWLLNTTTLFAGTVMFAEQPGDITPGRRPKSRRTAAGPD